MAADAEVGSFWRDWRHNDSWCAMAFVDSMIEEALRHRKTVVSEGRSSWSGVTKIHSRQTGFDIIEGGGNTALMRFDNLLKRRLRTANETTW